MTNFPMIDNTPIRINIHENFLDLPNPGSFVVFRNIPKTKIKKPKKS